MSHRPAPEGSPSLAERLERLFAVTRPEGDPFRRWRNREVVEACKEAGRELSEAHLSELRRGVKCNPTARVLRPLAWFFVVPIGYFIDDEVPHDVDMELATRAAALRIQQDTERRARAELAEAVRELRAAMSVSGMTQRATPDTVADVGAKREIIATMRALTRMIRDQPTIPPPGSGESLSDIDDE